MHFWTTDSQPRFSLFSFLTTFLLTAAMAVTVGGCVFFFLHSRSVIDRLMKDHLRSKAAIAARLFTGEEVEQIRTPEDMRTPLFADIVRRLRGIKEFTPRVRFAYIMRRSDDPLTLTFVADADALASVAQLDYNGNGLVDRDERPGRTGEPYAIAGIRALQDDAFRGPATDAEIVRDQWGYAISGYAPIRTEDGRVVAVLGIDMTADTYADIRRSIFSLQSLLLALLGIGLLLFTFMIVMVRHRLKEIRHLDDERRWLLQLILHQVGTPLTVFKWGVESLKDMLERLPADVRTEAEENVLMMEDGVSRLDHVSEVLLAADRVQEGRMQVEEETVSLRQIAEETIAGVASRLKQRAQRIDSFLPEDCAVRFDRRLLAGVIRELLDNAIAYAPKEGVISLRVLRKGKHVEVQVEDRGAGIPRRDLPRIFERFSRGSNAGTYDPNGTGVGLYIAKGIVERFGGAIRIESAEGKGTMVAFTLPLADA